MHKIFWTCVNVDVLLFRCAVCFQITSLIPHSLRISKTEKDSLQDDCKETVKEHRANYGVSCLFVPILVEVRLLPIKILEEERVSLLCEVGVHEKKKETSVEELAEEYTDGD
jgi:hypothetical protein